MLLSVILIFTTSIIIVSVLDKRAKQDTFNLQFEGVIKQLVKIEGQKGSYVLINNEWYLIIGYTATHKINNQDFLKKSIGNCIDIYYSNGKYEKVCDVPIIQVTENDMKKRLDNKVNN